MTEIYDDLQSTLEKSGAHAAISKLCAALKDQKDYTGLFYALLMKKRHELGVSPIPTGPAQALPNSREVTVVSVIKVAAFAMLSPMRHMSMMWS